MALGREKADDAGIQREFRQVPSGLDEDEWRGHRCSPEKERTAERQSV